MKLNHELVNQFAISLLKQESFEDFVGAVAHGVQHLLQFEYTAVYSVHGDAEFQLVAEASTDSDAGPDTLNPIAVSYGSGITGAVALSGTPEIIADTGADPRSVKTNFGGLSMISVPIEFEDKLVAIINCEARRTNAFSQSDIDNVVSLTQIAAPRIASTRLRQNEIQMQTQQVESLSIFVGGIAHDFNNHLLALITNLNAAKAAAHKNIEHYLDFSIQACEKSQGLALQLQAFAKGATTQMEVTELEPLVRDTAKLALTTRNSKYEIEVDEPLAAVLVDRSQIEQVVSNLLINADQASRGGGQITIRLSKQMMPKSADRKAVKIQIQDFGCGIPEQQQNKIFQPYFTTKSDGSGLGLATSYFIVQRHHGEIHVHSEVGQGTTFDVFLPIAPTDPTSAPTMANPSSQSNDPNGLKVMIVDDEESVLQGIAAFVSSLGYVPVLAESGKEAIYAFNDALISEQPIDVVIIDLNIPDGDGAAVLKHLRKLDPIIPAIVTSGYGNSPVMSSPAAYGFSGVLPKPFSLNQLKEQVQLALDSKAN